VVSSFNSFGMSAPRERCSKCGRILSLDHVCLPGVKGIAGILEPGSQLFGPYKILETLDSGGMGVIYKARHVAMDRVVAIKMLRSSRVSDEDIYRFDKEAKAVSRLNHPNIIAVHDLGITPDDQPFLVMDFIDGISLSKLIAQSGGLKLTQFFEIVRQIFAGMEHAHQKGIIHRDLKPSNIMLTKNEGKLTVKILDFGIAKIADITSDATLTKTGEIFGTPTYMSPEQAEGNKVDFQTDIYSTGCILFECLAGVPPFHGRSSIDIVMKHVNEEPPSIRSISGKQVPESVEWFVRKCLQKKPEDRFANFTEMIETIDRIQEGKLKKSNFPFRISRKTSSSIWLVAGVVVVLVATRAAYEYCFGNGEMNIQATKIKSSSAKRDDLDSLLLSDKVSPENLVKMLIKTSIQDNDPWLDLQKVPLNKESLKEVSNARGVRGISFASSDKGDDLIDCITPLHLERLNLTSTHITDKGLAKLAGMKTLTQLDLSHVNANGRQGITSKGLADVASLPHLHTLMCNGDNLHNEDIEVLKNARALQNLSISANSLLDGDCCKYLEQIPELQALNFAGTHIPIAAFVRMRNVDQITQLTLPIANFNGFELQLLAERAPKLERLEFTCKTLSPSALESLGRMKSLIELRIVDFPLSKKDLDYLGSKIPACRISDRHAGKWDWESQEH
jgi:serine/threonine protein kinase